MLAFVNLTVAQFFFKLPANIKAHRKLSRIINLLDMKNKIFTDSIHGFTACCTSKITAWGLIRNKCHQKGLEVPTMDQINNE